MIASTSPVRRRATTHVLVGNVMTPVERPLPTRVLGVWAHPDDECYLSAGLMSRVVANGGNVRLVCATRGELGTDDPDLFGTDRFARMRESELESSLAVLGVHDLRFLGLRDGACADADERRMATAIADEIVDFVPDAIVTFGPDGITGHSDHRAVSRWTTAAAASASRAELLYATVSHEHAARHRRMHDSLGLFAALEGGRPASIPSHRLALRCSLDHGELIRKRRALACHGSQTDGLAALMGEDVYFGWWRDECFRHPTPAESSAARRAVELLGDLVEAGT
jgi:LmbE family N-acetylglucosaminyl deacetylase